MEFSLDKIERDEKLKWGNFIKAVANELIKAGKPIGGAEILLDTNFSTSGGLSSSAALELCVAYGLLALVKEPIDPESLAWLCKAAENSEIVQSPCGFLDQGVIAFAKKDRLVFLDFQEPVRIRLVPATLTGAVFVVAIDKTVKRILGESGYPARRKMCEAACPILGVNSLREVSLADFKAKKQLLEPMMSKRVEHIVYENQRVLDAVDALQSNDLVKFGQLLNQSGKSALDLYDLDENTPELRYLMETAQSLPGVLGARNMGGGFSATILALVKDEAKKEFKEKLSQIYQKKYKNSLEFIEFEPGDGVRVMIRREL